MRVRVHVRARVYACGVSACIGMEYLYKLLFLNMLFLTEPLHTFLENPGAVDLTAYLLMPDVYASNSAQMFDVVNEQSKTCCCFTKK